MHPFRKVITSSGVQPPFALLIGPEVLLQNQNSGPSIRSSINGLHISIKVITLGAQNMLFIRMLENVRVGPVIYY